MQLQNQLIIFEHSPDVTKVALFKGKELVEFYFESDSYKSLIGNIYRGKVKRVLPQMESIFVDIGLKKPGLLTARNEFNKTTKEFSRKFHEGQIIWVQVKKDRLSSNHGIDEKGVGLTTDLSLESIHIILLPHSSGIFVSKKITDLQLRQTLVDKAEKALQEVNYSGGLLIRSCVSDCQDDHWLEDIAPLLNKWSRVKEAIQEQNKIGLVHSSGMLLETLRNQFKTLGISQVTGEEKVSSFFQPSFIPYKSISPLQLKSLYSEMLVEEQIHQAMQPKYELPKGGSIVIEETEALVAIDVNMGSALDQSMSNLDFNMQAARSIVQQIRLRNLAGIIVIDFVRMRNKKHRQLLINLLSELFSEDRVEVKIFGFTRIGLLEISRQRVGLSLSKIIFKNE